MADSRRVDTVAGRKPFWETAWPSLGAEDSASLRRRKLSVRAGHLAMTILVLVAASGAPLARPEDYTAAQITGLALAIALFLGWNLVGTRGIVTLVLWEQAEPPPK